MPTYAVRLIKNGQRFSFFQIGLINVWLHDLVKQEGHRLGQIVFNCCTDDALLEINKQFLDHDTLTDIITFDYSEPLGHNSKKLFGEVYISIPRVRENALQFSKGSFPLELLRVLAHGTLHLCGYRDKNPSERKEMEEKENGALDLFHRLQREFA